MRCFRYDLCLCRCPKRPSSHQHPPSNHVEPMLTWCNAHPMSEVCVSVGHNHVPLMYYGSLIVHGPDRVTVHPPPPPQDSLRPSFYCSLDLPGYQKSMPSKKSWDGLPVLGHFQNGRHWNLEITFCAITWVLRQLESQHWCLCICFWGWGIQFCQ